MTNKHESCGGASVCHSRRQFLATTGASAAVVMLGDLFAGRVFAQDSDREAVFAEHPRVRLKHKLSELAADDPQLFCFPGDRSRDGALIVKLGRPAGGGIGPEQDVVAFNTLCTHQGGDLSDLYNAEHKVLGPCREHLTSFDLTRHGLIVAGQASAPLPQIVLDLDGDDIYAVGVLGLIYGCVRNAC